MIKVYLNSNFIADGMMHDVTTGTMVVTGTLVPVAIIDTNDPEDVFRICQNFDPVNWTHKERVTDLTGISQRSFSMGDVIELESGKRLMADLFGFKEIVNYLEII